jgi:hypothetical protein
MAPPWSICSSVPSGERMNMLYCFEKSLQTKKKKKRISEEVNSDYFLGCSPFIVFGLFIPELQKTTN